jgi:hypothetical protein
MNNNRADKYRHWPVFWASFAVVLVTWGLVPTQAGIFSVRTVTRTTNMAFAVSQYSMPFEKQAKSLSYRFAESTYGIVSLNETLPPYMARNYTLTPFKPQNVQGIIPGQGSYTAPTTMYTLDLECEDVSHKAGNSSKKYTNNHGYTFQAELTGNLTIGDQPTTGSDVLAVKQYNGMYVGYHNGGRADFYLSDTFPESENSTFYASFAKSKARRPLDSF